MKYALFASLDEINGIIIPKHEYPLCIDVHSNVAYIMMKFGIVIQIKDIQCNGNEGNLYHWILTVSKHHINAL